MIDRRMGTYLCLLIAVLVALSAAAFQRNRVWHTRTSVWQDVTGKSPGKARGYYNYAVYLKQYGEIDKALELYSWAIMLEPGKENALVNRGNIYDDRGLTQQALDDYNRAIRANPRYESAYFNRAVAFERLGLIRAALADYRMSCDLDGERGCEGLQRLMTLQASTSPASGR